MTVCRLELDVPEPSRAETLFGQLLGGRAVHHDDRVVYTGLGGADLVCRATSTPGSLRRIAMTPADAGHPAPPDLGPAARRVLGVDVDVEADHPAPSPASTHPRGRVGATAFDHVCFAVASLRDAVELLCDGLGGRVVFGGHNRANGTLSSQVDLGGGTRVELLEPTRDDAAVARFLERFGPGMHHLTWIVADVPDSVAAAERSGFPVADTDLASRRHWRETYLPPSTTLGLLVQLAWTDHRHDTPLDQETVRAILDGRVDSHDYTMQVQPT